MKSVVGLELQQKMRMQKAMIDVLVANIFSINGGLSIVRFNPIFLGGEF